MRCRPITCLFLALGFFTTVLDSSVLRAEVIPSVVDIRFGWNRGATDSTYSGWNVFSNELPGPTIQDSTPELAGQTGPAATVFEGSGNAGVLGSGNIYAFSGTSQFEVTIPSWNLGSGYNSRVVVQFQTLGSELDYSSIRLSNVDLGLTDIAPNFTEEIERSSLGMGGPGGGGVRIQNLASWDISGNSGSFVVEFNSASSAMSLDRLHIDTFATAVPEPTSFLLLGATAGGLGLLNRRRIKNLVQGGIDS